MNLNPFQLDDFGLFIRDKIKLSLEVSKNKITPSSN